MGAMLKTALNINQWRNTNRCIKWFIDNDKNNKCSCVKYDTRELYLSIIEKAIDTLSLVKE